LTVAGRGVCFNTQQKAVTIAENNAKGDDMKNTNLTMAMTAVFVIAIGPQGAGAQDWPQWRGANRDGKVTGFTAPKTWPKALTQKWKTSVGSGDATPALVGDKLYVFARQEGDEVTRCLDASSGKELWQDKYAVPAISGPDAGQHGGPRSSLAVASGKVVTLGVCGTVSCLDAATGKMLWRKDDFPGAWPRFHVATSPMIADNLCIVQLGKPGDGAIVAYDLATGEQKWKWAGEGPAYASPVLLTVDGAKMILTQTEKSVVALSVAEGKLLWQTPFAAQGMSYNAATPIADGQTVIYCGQGRGTTAVKLEKQGDGFAAKELWKNPDNSVQFNTPVLKNGALYGLSARGDFFCINAQDGKTLWTAPFTPPAASSEGQAQGQGAGGGRRGGGMRGGGGYGSLVDAGSVMLALTPASQLVAFQPGDKAYTELARIKVADTPTYACPIVAGNRLFVKDQDSVTLWTFE
jgi:outer membrane protein assembly factor BamB